MAKRIPLRLCLLTSVILAAVSTPAMTTMAKAAPQAQLVAQSGIAEVLPQVTAQQAASAKATLTLQDLPPGFTALPPEIAGAISSRLDSLRQQLGQGNLKPDNFFAFVNQQNFQMVLGFTGKIPNQTEQGSFDTSLRQLQQPDAQQRLMSLLQERLKSFGGVKVTEYKGLPELNNLANVSSGVTLGLDFQGQPLQMDLVAFRRNQVGAFTAVMYAKGRQPAIALGDVARKLDSRIVQVSADSKRSPVARVQ